MASESTTPAGAAPVVDKPDAAADDHKRTMKTTAVSPTPASPPPAPATDEPRTVRLRSLATRPMPDPMRPGLEFDAQDDEITRQWIAMGWAEEV